MAASPVPTTSHSAVGVPACVFSQATMLTTGAQGSPGAAPAFGANVGTTTAIETVRTLARMASLRRLAPTPRITRDPPIVRSRLSLRAEEIGVDTSATPIAVSYAEPVRHPLAVV